VRLLLDHDASGPRVGARLAEQGHDARALDQEPQNAGLADDEVPRLGAREERIVITHDVNTFPAVLRDFAERREPHAGAIVLVGIRSRDFDLIVRATGTWLARYPQQAQWRDMAVLALSTNPRRASRSAIPRACCSR
jgi:predicted nuclease of predicted toxin-antitoxin system